MIFQLDKIEKKSIKKESRNGFIFTYQDIDYYFKYLKKQENYLNELIACEIAKRLNIHCCDYYLGIKSGMYASVSKLFDTSTYQSMHEILFDYYQSSLVDKYNNFQDISHLFNDKYGLKVKNRLMNQLENIFLFDVLIANLDRHSNNYGLWKNNGVIEFAPLFDQENMLANLSIYRGIYSIGIDEKDFLEHFYFLSKESSNLLEKFLLLERDNNIRKLETFLPQIERNQIEAIIEKIEEEIRLKIKEKNYICNRFQKNKDNIEIVLEKVYKKTL